MAILEEEKRDVALEPDKDIQQWERVSQQTRSIVVGTLILSFIVGFWVGDGNSRTDQVMRIATGLGAAFGTLIFAGIPSAIAAKFTPKWRFVWLGIAIVLLVAQIVSHLYGRI